MRTWTYWLRVERDRDLALSAIYKAKLNDGWQVQLRKLRTLEQNARLHAMLTDVAGQLLWPQPPRNDGELHDVEWWKRRTELGWLIDINEKPEVIESLDGSTFALLLPHTSDLDTEQMASYIEWLTAFGTMNGVVFTDPNEGPPVPEDYR
jgi:hypothetical protein